MYKNILLILLLLLLCSCATIHNYKVKVSYFTIIAPELKHGEFKEEISRFLENPLLVTPGMKITIISPN
jgi:hypothetical protein